MSCLVGEFSERGGKCAVNCREFSGRKKSLFQAEESREFLQDARRSQEDLKIAREGAKLKMKRLYQLLDELALGYELQLRRFREIRDFARRQQEVMQAGGVLQLDETLARRQALMGEVDETARKLASLREEVQQILHLKEFKIEKVKELAPVPACAKLGEILRELTGVIEETQRHDRENTLLLENYLKAIRKSFQDLQTHRAAHQAYRSRFPGGGVFLDLKK